MLHIIFIILKVIGVLLLVILGLLALAVLCMLFVPVCYRLEGIKNPEEVSGSVRISWLGGLLMAKAVISRDGTFFVIRIFGITLDRLKETGSKIKRLFRRRSLKMDPGKPPVEIPSLRTGPPDAAPKARIPEAGGRIERNPGQTGDFHTDQKLKQAGPGVFRKLRLVWQRVRGVPAAIRSMFRKFKLTITGIYAKIKKWKSFLTDETTKETIRFLWDTSKSLLKHLIPRKAKGHVTFGFDDPALTGKALGVCGLIVPLYQTKLQVIPVFDQEILEGRIVLSGHMLGVVLLRLGWRVYRCKSVKKTIRRFQHKEA